MTTILDQLTLELGWDVKKFLEGAKATEKITKEHREDFERHGKVFELVLTNISRYLTRLVAGFLAVETAIKAFESTKQISRSGTEFANLAQSIGMSVEQLGQWEQALERVGGRAEEVGQAFQFQQRELMKSRGPQGGAPSFLGWMQRLGLDPNRYWDEAKKAYDLDRLNKDIADAMQRQNMTPAQRTQVLEAFGFHGPAAQRLFSNDLRSRLDRTRLTAPTAANEAAFRRLNELWTTLGQTAERVHGDLVTYLQDPIAWVLTKLRELLDLMRGSVPDWLKSAGETATRLLTPPPDWRTHPAPAPSPAAPWAGPGASMPIPPPPAPRPLVPGAPPPGADMPVPAPAPRQPLTSEGSGGAVSVGPRTGVRSLTSPWWRQSAPPPSGSAPAPPLDPSRAPPSGVDMPLPLPDGSFRGSSLDLPRMARDAGVAPQGSVSSVSNSSLTIGAMTFNSRSSDTAMGQAPSSVEKDLSVASYAIHANEAWE